MKDATKNLVNKIQVNNPLNYSREKKRKKMKKL